MTAPERLCLTSDRGQVVESGHPRAAFLLCAKGQTIPTQYLPLVTAYLEGKTKSAAKPEEAPTPAVDDSEPFADRETRIPQKLSKRGRPRRPSGDSGDIQL